MSGKHINTGTVIFGTAIAIMLVIVAIIGSGSKSVAGTALEPTLHPTVTPFIIRPLLSLNLYCKVASTSSVTLTITNYGAPMLSPGTWTAKLGSQTVGAGSFQLDTRTSITEFIKLGPIQSLTGFKVTAEGGGASPVTMYCP